MSTALAVERKAIRDIDDVYDANREQELLAAVFEDRYEAMLAAVHEVVKTALDLADDYRLDDRATNRVLVEAAQRVVRIDETTRAAIAEQLRLGQEMGLSSWEIANGAPKLGYRGIEGLYSETWKGRADLIARTELQHAQNVASLDRYAATGLVDRVTIIDGDDWDEPCRNRNGKTVPLGSRPGLLHPACTLVVVPVLREGLV